MQVGISLQKHTRVRTVLIFLCTFQLHYLSYHLKKQSCNIYKYRTYNKDWPAKKVTIFNTIVHLVKTSENILVFCLQLPDYVADEITKEF